ncbi:MAG TPA: hypothetical protein VIY26_08620 [Acidimicrobiales bacterium]
MASAIGAVLAALIASSFGVTGTVIGVAIGSAAATIGSALVTQSIERGQHAVKQVAVRVQDTSTSPLLRRLGGTASAGETASSSVGASSPADAAPTQVVGPAADETAKMESGGASADEANRLEISAVADAPATERLQAQTVPVPAMAPAADLADATAGTDGQGDRNPGDGWLIGRKFSWKAIAGTSAIVFVLALLLITAIELIAGKPLASIFGSNSTGPTISHIFGPSSPGSTTTTTTSPAGATTTTNSSSTTSSSTTTTSPSAGNTATTTTPTTSTTTTTGGLGATTTTTPGANTTTTTASP